jgi:hypothetical protein
MTPTQADVKRYDLAGNEGSNCYCGIDQDSAGRFVLYTDYERVEKERDALLEALADLVKINEQHNAEISALIGKPLGWKDTYLDAARAALAGEGKA